MNKNWNFQRDFRGEPEISLGGIYLKSPLQLFLGTALFTDCSLTFKSALHGHPVQRKPRLKHKMAFQVIVSVGYGCLLGLVAHYKLLLRTNHCEVSDISALSP